MFPSRTHIEDNPDPSKGLTAVNNGSVKLRLRQEFLNKTLRLGNFCFAWRLEPEGPSLTITSKAEPEFIWSTPPGIPFLRTGQYRYSVNERHSSYKISHATEAMAFQTVSEFSIDEELLIISGTVVTIDQITHPYRFEFKVLEQYGLAFNCIVGQQGGFIELLLALMEGQPLQGLGEQFTFMDARGHRVPLMTQEGGVGRGAWPISALVNMLAPGAQGHPFSSYCPMAVCHHHYWALYIENTEYQEFDLIDSQTLKIIVFSNQVGGALYVHQNPLKRLQKLTTHTGRMHLPPRWLDEGAVVAVQGGSAALMSKMNLYERAGVQVSAYWIQDWIGRRVTSFGDQLWWNYELDEKRYPDLRAIKQTLYQKNIPLLGYINPMVVDVSGKPHFRRNLFQEGKENQFFVLNEVGDPYPVHITDFYGFMVDLTNPEARGWYKEIIHTNLIAKAEGKRLFDGAMADFGEGLPLDAKLFDGTDALAYHNQYPVEWARLVNEVCQEEGSEELYFFQRAGFTKIPQYTHSLWSGDQNHTYDRYDGLHSALIAMLNAGLSGISALHSDIGGYTTFAVKGLGFVRRKGLMQTWMEMSAFTSVFRTHEGSKPAWNVQVDSDEQSLALFARFSKIYRALSFYRCALYQQASQNGWPLVRQLGLHYPNDSRCRLCDSQFLLGSEFLIAPILNHVQRKLGRKVYLPQENWVHLWTGKKYPLRHRQSKSILVKAPVGFPPVFYKEGSEAAKTFIQNLKLAGIDVNDLMHSL